MSRSSPMSHPTWDDPRTVSAYERFSRTHVRYRRANAELTAHADIRPDHRVLDVGAGTGRTTDAVLAQLGERGRVTCVEPARAMRERGMRRVKDPRVVWTSELPTAEGQFDRVVCGAAIWQFDDVRSTLASLAALLRDDGALAFNIPAQYLLEPDEPGGGADPLLLSLVQRVAEEPSTARPVAAARVWSVDDVADALRAAGLDARRWEFRVRLTQAAYRDWLAIPVVAGPLMNGRSPREWRQRLGDAFTQVDRASWRWERWIGWTGWKRC